MSHYNENRGLFYRSYLPGHLRQRSASRDQLVIPSACIPMVLHACHAHVMSGGHFAYKYTFDNVRDSFGGRRYIMTSKLNFIIATLANDVKDRIVGRSYLQVTYPLIAYSNVFQ